MKAERRIAGSQIRCTMPQSLLEYADSLDQRDLRWPAPPKFELVNATPSLKPLAGMRGVTWSLYGTLLRITDGELLLRHPQALRMEVAIEKTIQEFNMCPGKPADLMLPKYLNLLEEARLTSTSRKGDYPEIDAAQIWRKLLELLDKKEYRYDESVYGDWNELSQKVAYFFQTALQGTEGAQGGLATLHAISTGGLRQAALADAQSFTLVLLTRALRSQGNVQQLDSILPDSLNILSYASGIRKPSKSLYAEALLGFQKIGIEPHQILHISSRIHDDLAIAKSCGMRTVLFAGDKTSLKVTSAELKDPAIRPDRLVTELIQLREILQV